MTPFNPEIKDHEHTDFFIGIFSRSVILCILAISISVLIFWNKIC